MTEEIEVVLSPGKYTELLEFLKDGGVNLTVSFRTGDGEFDKTCIKAVFQVQDE